ncbi:MAG: hypothetical protein FD123_1163 [Bacteroidetes bacterium]|nr:MAG: hypothetical protein FD123_1163 [Bacteroidota bacterium]
MRELFSFLKWPLAGCLVSFLVTWSVGVFSSEPMFVLRALFMQTLVFVAIRIGEGDREILKGLRRGGSYALLFTFFQSFLYFVDFFPGRLTSAGMVICSVLLGFGLSWFLVVFPEEKMPSRQKIKTSLVFGLITYVAAGLLVLGWIAMVDMLQSNQINIRFD